ncbi:MAG: tetratricopeptide repeat protein [Bacteroidales bacterium]|jgi:hypothetical protein|nr:tetratricopeptide repeat protein [Bacteroidales bacterium]
MRTKYLIILALPLLLLGCDKKKNAFRSANSLYENKEYQKAEKEYRRVLTMDSTYHKAIFNLANTEFRKGDTASLQAATDTWQKAFDLSASDSSLAADVVYNQSNVKFKKAIDTAFLPNHSYDYDLLKQAREGYKQVLRQFPDDSAARYNLALANYLINKQPKSNQQRQQQNQNNQQNQQQQQQQNQPQNQQNQNQQQQNQQQQSQQQQMKKNDKEINRMLEALKNNEKKTLKKLKKRDDQQATKYQSDKDW